MRHGNPLFFAKRESLVHSKVFIKISATSHRRQHGYVAHGEGRGITERRPVQVCTLSGYVGLHGAAAAGRLDRSAEVQDWPETAKGRHRLVTGNSDRLARLVILESG